MKIHAIITLYRRDVRDTFERFDLFRFWFEDDEVEERKKYEELVKRDEVCGRDDSSSPDNWIRINLKFWSL